MSDQNLKEETLAFIFSHGKTVENIEWIGAFDGSVKIELGDFLKTADRIYAAGYGSNEVNGGLVIVGRDWWMSRWEYDGSEGWEWNTKPELEKNYKLGTEVFVKEYQDDWGIIDNLTYIENKAKAKDKGII